MPNLAWGTVSVTGTKENVLKFTKRFLYDDIEPDIPYFARSFVQSPRSDTVNEINKCFKHLSLEIKVAYTFYVDFAWSAYSCLIDGYPQKYPEDCIALKDACIADNVSVEIKTEEPGFVFEEEIFCSEDGSLDEHSRDLLSFACEHCGRCNFVASFGDPVDYECNECSKPLVLA